MHKIIIPVGTYLWHGTSAREDFDIPEGPAYFTDVKKAAKEFVKQWAYGGPRPRILEFVVRTKLNILMLEHGDQVMGNRRDLVKAVCGKGAVGFVVQGGEGEGFLAEANEIVLCRPEDYLRRTDEQVVRL